MRPTIDDSQLDDALRGKVAGLDPKDAVSRLARSTRADRGELLAELVDQHPDPVVRYRAALALSLAPDARAQILARLAEPDPLVRAGLLLSLGRVGEPVDVTAMREASRGLVDQNARRAELAVLLLAHRHALPEAVVPAPPPANTVLPAEAVRRYTVGEPAEAAAAWRRFTASAALGMTPAPTTATLIEGKQSQALVVLADSFTPQDAASGRRAVAGLIAIYDRETGAFHHDSWILTGDGQVDVWSLGGKRLYSGRLETAPDGQVSFQVATVEATGLAPLVAVGHLRDGQLSLVECYSDPFARRAAARPRPQ